MHPDSQKLRRSCLALHLLSAGDLRRYTFKNVLAEMEDGI
jgi:hypothetical protein